MCLRIDEKLSLGTFSVVYCAPLVLSFKQANYVRYKDHLLCSEHPVRPSYTRLGNEVNMKSDRCWVLCATYVYVYVHVCIGLTSITSIWSTLQGALALTLYVVHTQTCHPRVKFNRAGSWTLNLPSNYSYLTVEPVYINHLPTWKKKQVCLPCPVRWWLIRITVAPK
ncbi:hypothetical protein GGS24DRAFT_444688 [Hypoxylon argillaceum]|nr:hypothetical protein GGS24DRAFT_444688 [Hypoxylon argillaceum]